MVSALVAEPGVSTLLSAVLFRTACLSDAYRGIRCWLKHVHLPVTLVYCRYRQQEINAGKHYAYTTHGTNAF